VAETDSGDKETFKGAYLERLRQIREQLFRLGSQSIRGAPRIETREGMEVSNRGTTTLRNERLIHKEVKSSLNFRGSSHPIQFRIFYLPTSNRNM
jgi:hypothetical protein